MKYKNDKPRIRTGVKALIVDNDEILLIRESVREGIIYDFPGGGIDYSEDLDKALHREVFEEVGLEIEVDGVVGAWSFMLDFAKTQIVCIGYQCKCKDRSKIDLTKNPATEENIFEFKWVHKDEILANPEKYLRVPGMLESVKNLK